MPDNANAVAELGSHEGRDAPVTHDGAHASPQAASAVAIERALNPPPLVVVLSGPSGVGKDEILNELKKRDYPFHLVVTATTRPQRPGEVDGEDYLFVSMADFAELVQNDELLEHAVVYGDYKGIPKQQVRDALASGKDVILRIDVQGARTVRRLIDGAVSIFMIAEDLDELERRLRERKSEPPDRLKMRIATARQELRQAAEFDYVIVNRRDQVKHTVDTIIAIIIAEKHRTRARPVSL
ncbi:MAG: guanylate kinase [Anaerolineae bacterium]